MLLMSVVLMRVHLDRPLFVGMLTVMATTLPMLVLGAHPAVVLLCVSMALAGAGIEVFSLAWTLAMMENIDERLQSRAWSYDSVGSFVAIPAGQLLYGPLGDWFGYREVLLASAVVYVVVASLALLSRDVRTLSRVSTTSRSVPG
jgi:predicted MFS family arabinose efflux permease